MPGDGLGQVWWYCISDLEAHVSKVPSESVAVGKCLQARTLPER